MASPSRRTATVAAAGLAALVLAGGLVALVASLREESPPPAPPTPVEEQVASWRAGRRVAAAASPGEADGRVEAGRAALAADAPSRIDEALGAFRAALAADPGRLDAVAGYATAVAERLGADPDADAGELRVAHALLAHARAVAPERPDVLAAWARLLLAVPSASNDAEALAAAERAHLLAPADPSARLALAAARGKTDPAGAARLLEDGLAAEAPDLRVLSAAARARWAARDAAGALALLERRLRSPDGAAALELRAEIEAASGRSADARATLARLAAADPASALPPLLLARLAYQEERDLARARRLLDDALSRGPGDFVAARILAHRAAVERAAGDAAAAARSVEEALRRVPGDAPARFQEALLAFERGDVAALRRAAGVVADRAGPLAAKLLAARALGLAGPIDDAVEAYRAAAERSRDPATLLAISGLVARAGAPGPALELARRALARDPVDGRIARAPTDFWEGPAALAAASGSLEAIARAEPQVALDALSAAAACELLLGRTVAAERLARDASAASPQASYPLALLAQVALDRGELPAAARLARAAAVRARPGDAFPASALARALAAAGREDAADAALREAVEASPAPLTARLALARSLARRGRGADAASLLEGLLAEDPDLAEARGALLALRATR